MSALFTPLSVRGIEMRNRLWVSPMCQYSAVDGMPNEWHHVHLAQFAAGGAGLVIAEASAVSPEGRISPDDAGLWTDAHAAAWAPIVAAIRARGAVAGVQLGHAGRKASTTSPLTGGRGSVAADAGGWTTVAPSALAYDRFAVPVALDAAGIEKVVADFADAARRAVAAEFQVVEIHAAHGYLLHQFLSPLTNHRDDAYGGSFENRVRLLVRVTEAVRAAAPDAAVFVRFSATDAAEGGWDVTDTVAASRLVAAAGADLIDVSSGGLVPEQYIVPGPGYQVDYAATVRRETGLLVAAVGMIDDPTFGEQILADGRADAILSAREWLRDPHYALRAAAALGDEVPAPAQYARAY
ncbi:NADH:flavin oxidoreductase/NADH oxidase [Microbacterium trichothecenolyticum]|uniref:2,4-dienoyl-CoA reductase-like NADH-dependent reductase (Old Yellow Enzyme family) n=1 Tax=Microbacterium trichothecenolyticum TaxID=69370 RepID=A0ABU0TTB5_MICTR|nr:NADH:flavin oxidoreductase/NADH oxidase [Microbacterium trichothecenolyticum]MDQ1122906.1 2,4-dienoyl-CoA reductase-like NADH-dependent reductase (Old Yellow Enzyme family) [Microbacterium trichothecenolyticum]